MAEIRLIARPGGSDAGHARLIAGLCFLALATEGFGLQLAGVAAPLIRATFGLSPSGLGLFFTGATLGLAVGAIAGGRLSDRFGRKGVLLISLATYGISCVGAALSPNLSTLLALRFIGGISLGGALPNLIAIAAETSLPGRSRSAVTIAYAGAPAGGAVVSLVAATVADWRTLFVVSGLAALLVVPLLSWCLVSRPASNGPAGHGQDSAGGRHPGLFSNRAAGAQTLALWIAFCGTSLMLYLLISWLPLLLVSKGLSRADASLAQLTFTGVGAIAGFFVGRALELFDPKIISGAMFALVLAAVLLLAKVTAPQMTVLLLQVALLGIGINAAQAISFSIAPGLYVSRIRATGVGAAIATARVGGVAGPLLATAVLASGHRASGVFLAIVPIALISGLCVLFLVDDSRRG